MTIQDEESDVELVLSPEKKWTSFRYYNARQPNQKNKPRQYENRQLINSVSKNSGTFDAKESDKPLESPAKNEEIKEMHAFEEQKHAKDHIKLR